MALQTINLIESSKSHATYSKMNVVSSIVKNQYPSIPPRGGTNSKPSQSEFSRRRHLLTTIPVILTSQFIEIRQNEIAIAAATNASGDWSSPGLASVEDDLAPRFYKTASGVTVQELFEGNGDVGVRQGDRVLIDYVLRRSNGYFIYGTVEGVSFQPRDIPTGPIVLNLTKDEVIPGLIDGLIGLKPGGKRRILVPVQLGYGTPLLEPKMPTFATSRQLENHKNEPLLFEVELLRIIA